MFKPTNKKIPNQISPFIKKKAKLPITKYLPNLLLNKKFFVFFLIKGLIWLGIFLFAGLSLFKFY